MKKAIGLNGIFAGQELLIEGSLSKVFGPRESLPDLAARGNPTALNAIYREHYTYLDEPFFYGKMGALGYIIAQKDFKFTEAK